MEPDSTLRLMDSDSTPNTLLSTIVMLRHTPGWDWGRPTTSLSLRPPLRQGRLGNPEILHFHLAAEILSVLVLIITLILAFRKLTTNNTGNATQTLPAGPDKSCSVFFFFCQNLLRSVNNSVDLGLFFLLACLGSFHRGN